MKYETPTYGTIEEEARKRIRGLNSRQFFDLVRLCGCQVEELSTGGFVVDGTVYDQGGPYCDVDDDLVVCES